jgi:hypothetical protein
MAVYPDISAELPGVDLEEDEQEYQMVMDKPKPDFWDLAGAALHNVGINAEDMLRAARAQAADKAQWQGPALVEANEDRFVYKITFDLPDAGLPTANADLQVPLGMTGLTWPWSPSHTTTTRHDVIRYKLAGEWLAINRTTDTHPELPFCN